MRRIRFLYIGLVLALLAFASSGHAFAETDAERQARIDDYVRTAEIDPTRPGADDPRVHEGMAALKARDFERAVAIWHPLAEAGNAEAQFRMGLAYEYGLGVRVDGNSSLEWISRSSSFGHLGALTSLAYAYGRGTLVERDDIKARQLNRDAAIMGEAVAQFNLGLMIFAGHGGEQKKIEGLAWLLFAIKNGAKNRKIIDDLRDFYSDTELAEARRKKWEWLKSHSR